MPDPRVYLLTSGKGGVGKSTLALALADVWASVGARVALVDFDPQGGATLAAGVVRPDDPLTAPPVAVHGFTLWPGGRALALATGEELAHRLDDATRGADVVLVDCSPALTDTAHAVTLPRASRVLVVARCDAAGLPNVAEAAHLAEAAHVPFSVVPTFKGTTGLSREALAFLRGRYGAAVAGVEIPTDAKAAEAAGIGRPVTRTAPRARVSLAVRALVEELGALTVEVAP